MPLSLVSGGVVIEMELADVDQAFDSSTNTPNWEIKDVSMLCSMHTVDSSLANSYAKHILGGNSINFHTKSMVSTKHVHDHVHVHDPNRARLLPSLPGVHDAPQALSELRETNLGFLFACERRGTLHDIRRGHLPAEHRQPSLARET
jgi:hypothetical protein